jgi:hypothetical protein
MIGFFPVPYPDEILYSVFARYHLRTRNRTVQATARQLFGHKHSRFVVDFPNKLGYLISQMPPGHNFSVDRLIDKHTLLPFYSPFLLPDKVSQVRRDMTERSLGGSIHGRIGNLTSNIQVKYLRFCPVCVENDINLCGEPYWHRVHQLPGILVCPQHSVFLENSNVEYSHKVNKNSLITGKQAIQKISPRFLDSANPNHSAHLFLAKQGYWLLQNSGINYCGPHFFRNRFFVALFRKNLATINRVWITDIHKLFGEFYDSEFLSLLSSSLQNKFTWLRRLLQESKHSQHPIRNLLLIYFLGYSIEDFLNLPEVIYPFGKPPYPCLNSASDHYLELRIKTCHINGRRIFKTVGTFSCDCGFVYRRFNLDEQGKRLYEYDQVIYYGEAFYKKLIELQQNGLDIISISSTLEFPERIIKSQLRNVSLNSPAAKAQKRKILMSKKQKKRLRFRSEWRDLLNSYPQLSRMELKLINPTAYSWLQLKDKEWFDKNKPTRRKITDKDNRINWKEKDNELSIKAETIALEMLNSTGKPVRVSVTGVAGKLSIAYLVNKRPDCIPKTIQILKKYAESTEEFIVRRLRFSTDCCIKEKFPAADWQLMIRASVMKPHLVQLPKVQKEIAESLKRIKVTHENGWQNVQ